MAYFEIKCEHCGEYEEYDLTEDCNEMYRGDSDNMKNDCDVESLQLDCKLCGKQIKKGRLE